MNIPFLDLKSQNESIKREIYGAIREVIDSCCFAGGPFVEKFEEEFARFCHCREAVAVGSGTSALWLSLLALGIGPGDEVITVPNTFIATAEAISHCGAKPVFVDIDEHSYTLDPLLLDQAITSKTRAIIPVHLYGQMADMDAIMEIAQAHHLFVIEDACQAHGAEYKQRKAGSIGIMGCFSFYPGKNLGAFGDAGSVVTNDGYLAERIRRIRDHGQEKKYIHSEIGWNARMDGLQGAILSVKLRHLARWNESRRQSAELYNQLLAANGSIKRPAEATSRKHIYHIYAIRAKQRDRLIAHLKQKQIQTGIHYPIPIHQQEAYRELYGKMHLPVAERCAEEFISLPMYPEMSPDAIEYVVSQIGLFMENMDQIPEKQPAVPL